MRVNSEFLFFMHLDLLLLLIDLNELIKQIQLHCVFYFFDLLPTDDLSLIVLSLKSVTDCAEQIFDLNWTNIGKSTFLVNLWIRRRNRVRNTE